MISMQSTSGIPPTGIVVSILWLGIIRIDMNTLPPGVDGESRRLELTGMVKNPLSHALAELRAHPPSARSPGCNFLSFYQSPNSARGFGIISLLVIDFIFG